MATTPLQKLCLQMLADYLSTRLPLITLATPAAPGVSVQGAGGATAYSYKAVAISRAGKVTAASVAGITAVGSAALSSANFNRLTLSPVADARGYLVFRTAGGVTQGVIARLAPGAALSLDDTGLPADGTAPPTASLARVLIGEQDPEAEEDFPTVTLIPAPMTFDVMNPDVVDDVSFTDKVVMELGCWSGNVEIRISAANVTDRDTLQQSIQDVMIDGGVETTRRSTVVLMTPALTIGPNVTLYSAPIAFSLNGDSWNEELVFAKRRYVFGMLDFVYPALAVWDGAYTIDEMVLVCDAATNSDAAPTPDTELTVTVTATPDPFGEEFGGTGGEGYDVSTP